MQRSLPLGVFIASWPSWYFHVGEKPATRQAIPNPRELYLGATFRIWALSLSFIEDLQQKDFWAIYVAEYAAESLQSYPKVYGRDWKYNGNPAATAKRPTIADTGVRGPDYDKYVRTRNGTDQEIRDAYGLNVAQDMRARGMKVYQAIQTRAIAAHRYEWQRALQAGPAQARAFAAQALQRRAAEEAGNDDNGSSGIFAVQAANNTQMEQGNATENGGDPMDWCNDN